MKAKLSTIGLIAIAIIALALIGCPEPEPTEEQPVATKADLTFGDLTVTLNYKKKASEEVPAYIDRIQNRLDALAAMADPTNEDYNPANESLVNDLTSRDGDYSINVIYGGAPFNGFRAVDGQTLEAHNSWLTDNAGTITTTQLRTAFQAMLALPAIDENGVPYYGKLPNGVKIYKGDDSVTDVQMAAAIARIQTAYADGITAGGEEMENNFQSIINSIHITLGTDIVRKGNIIEFGCDAIEEYPGTAFAMIAMGLDDGSD